MSLRTEKIKQYIFWLMRHSNQKKFAGWGWGWGNSYSDIYILQLLLRPHR